MTVPVAPPPDSERGRPPARTGARRVARWALATAVALLVLAAVSVRASPRLASGQEVRVIAAAICLFAALVAPRLGTRVEAAGFVVAALALLASAGIDALAVRSAAAAGRDGLGADAVRERLLVAKAASGLLGLGVPIAVGLAWMRIPVPDLLRPPGRAAKPLLAALLMAVLLYPALMAFERLAGTALADLLAPPSASRLPLWPGWKRVLGHEPFPSGGERPFAHAALTIGVQLPLLEILVHGVLRQAFHRWGALPFVVATAALASLLMTASSNVSFAIFGAALVTGLFAARTGSVFPGVAFWLAFFVTSTAWARFLPL